MANIVLDGDMSTGHSGFPAVPVHASSNVTINGKKIVLDGDAYSSHSKDGSTHTDHAVGNSGITINGKKIVLAGSITDHGDTSTASSSVSVS